MNGPLSPTPGPLAPGKARLLLAEDEPSTWQFLGELLQDEYVVDLATDGAQAWEAAHRHPPDLVLSDVRMPGIDGCELTRRLRADARMAGVPVILLTASNEMEAQQEGWAAGASDFLRKPFRPRELLACLRGWLAVSQRRQAVKR